MYLYTYTLSNFCKIDFFLKELKANIQSKNLKNLIFQLISLPNLPAILNSFVKLKLIKFETTKNSKVISKFKWSKDKQVG